MEVVRGNVYDYPKYYDALFAADWKAEYQFLLACFERYASRKVRRVHEPACGTGRLLVKLAQGGFDVAGGDLNPKAVDYCNQRMKRLGFPPTAVVEDMSDFRVRKSYDAAFNTINSFRHLGTEEAAEGHLRCMADALAKGGIYILGFHLTPRGEPVCDRESWSARRGSLCIASEMWTLDIDRRRRIERVAFELDVRTPSRRLLLKDEFPFRTYTPAQFSRLLDRVESLELVETYDFDYDIETPQPVDSKSEDVIYVLRKKG